MSLLIDYKDHFSYFDHNISAYNFLQYSNRKWLLFNPSLHYQNRLRHKDYHRLFMETGFEIIDEQRTDGTTADFEIIERLSLDKRFGLYTTSELAVRNSHVILKKLMR